MPAPELEHRSISPGFVAVLAAACGLAVANLYYAQPLLHTIAAGFHAGSATAGLVVTLAQVGYAVGLALLVPVGDIVERRRLVPGILLVTAVALGASAVAPTIGALIVLAVFVGLGSVAAQVLVPLAASLADDANRGRVVGTVMSGLLLGILLARTTAGLIAGASSWRVVYWTAAGLASVLAVVLYRILPQERARPALSYPSLLKSTLALFASEPLLRRRSVLGALGFAAFSVFWTTVAFMLAGPPYRYHEAVIGLFGLIGAAGALCATYAGRLADQGRTTTATLVFVTVTAVSFGPIYLGHRSLGWLIAGIVLLDVGVQGLQVTNQSLIYRLAPAARSRVTSSYMVVYFIGGAVGSAVSGTVYADGGWSAVCGLGAAIGVAAMALWAYDTRRPVRPRLAVPVGSEAGG